MTLADLQVNSLATVDHLTGPRAFIRRLLSMGVSPGSQIRVVRYAPLGDPIQVEIGRLQLAIRRVEASHVLVH